METLLSFLYQLASLLTFGTLTPMQISASASVRKLSRRPSNWPAEALDDLLWKRFFQQLNEQYAAIRADQETWEEEMEERQLGHAGAKRKAATPYITRSYGLKRCRPESNRGWRFCRPLPYRLATAPSKRATGLEPATSTLARLRSTN